MAVVLEPLGGRATNKPLVGTSPQSVARRRQLAEAMLLQGQDSSPIQHWSQGAARVAKALIGGWGMHKADEEENAARSASRERGQSLVDALTGRSGSRAEDPAMPFASANQQAVADALNGGPAQSPPNWNTDAGVSPTTQHRQPPIVQTATDYVPQGAYGITPQLGPSIDEIVAVFNDPWADEGSRALASTLLQRHMQQNDPAYQIGLEESRVRLEQLRNPVQPLTDDMREYDAAVQGGYEGTFYDWMKGGGTQAALPADVQTYNFYAEQESAAGREPLSFLEFQAAAKGNTANTDFDNIAGLRKEIQSLPSYKNMAQALPIFRSMVATVGNNSRASDLNLVYGLGKIMDPTSVVREGEMILAKDTAALPDWFIGAMNRLNGGQALQPATRAAILQEAAVRAQAYQTALDEDLNQYRGIVERNGFNPLDVLPDFGAFPQWPPENGPFARTATPDVQASPAPPLGRAPVIIDGIRIERID